MVQPATQNAYIEIEHRRKRPPGQRMPRPIGFSELEENKEIRHLLMSDATLSCACPSPFSSPSSVLIFVLLLRRGFLV